MADEPLPPVGGKAPLPVSSPKDSAPPVSPTGEQAPVGIGPSAVVTLSDGALEAAEDDHHAIDDDKHALKDAASLIKDLTKAVRKLQKAVFRFMHHLEKLQHHAEKIADKFFDRVSRDIGGGRFEDYTHGQALSTLIAQFGAAGRGGKDDDDDDGEHSLDALSRDIGAGRLLDETQASALAITYSQTITFSVKSLVFTYQDGDQNVSLSYQSISFSVTTTIGAVFAQSDPQVIDTEGNSVDTATLNNGVFFDSKLETVADIVARLRGGGEEHDTDDLGDELKGLKALIKALARFRKGQADRSLFGALNTLLLIREVTFTQTVTGIGITRILLDAATQVREDGAASGDTASTAPTVGETPVDLEI